MIQMAGKLNYAVHDNFKSDTCKRNKNKMRIMQWLEQDDLVHAYT